MAVPNQKSQGPLPPEEREKLKEKVINQVRAVLLPEKHGMLLDNLNNEYRSFMGEKIPWRQMGYSKLDDFVDQNPQLFKIEYKMDGPWVKAVASEETQHIKNMVSAQRTKAKRAKPKPARRLTRMPNWVPPVSNNAYGSIPQRLAASGRPVGGRKPRQPTRNSALNGTYYGAGDHSKRSLPNGASLPRLLEYPSKSSSYGYSGYTRSFPTSVRKQEPWSVTPNYSATTMHNRQNLAFNFNIPPPKLNNSVAKNMVTRSLGINTNRSFEINSTKTTNGKQEIKDSKISTSETKLNEAASTCTSNNIDKTISNRIIVLVNKRTNGVWATQLEVEYSRQFKEQLPQKWTYAIEKDKYATEHLSVNRPLPQDPDRCIISKVVNQNLTKINEIPSNENNSYIVQQNIPKANNPTINSTSHSYTVSHATTNKKVQPPPLILPKEKLWDVYVTFVHSTIDVCIRILGDTTSAVFDELVSSMEIYYSTQTTDLKSINAPEVGRFYAVCIDEEWHRVEVTHVRGIDVSCYFIDHGDEDNLKAADLKELQDDFLKLAPQAKHVRLAGLEDFRDSSSATASLIKRALGRSLVGNVHTNDREGVSLVLWDTSGDEEDININETLLMHLKDQHKASYETLSHHSSMPSLDSASIGKSVVQAIDSKHADSIPNNETIQPTNIKNTNLEGFWTISKTQLNDPTNHSQKKNNDKEIMMNIDISSFIAIPRFANPDDVNDYFDVTVTLAGSPSNFTVQPYFEGRALENLSLEMNKFYNDEKNHYDKGPLTSDHLSKDFFFAGKHDDGQWYRVKVNSMLDEYSAAVKLVDYGDYSMMQLENMQPLWPQFRHLSMQAISASLADIVPIKQIWTPEDAVYFTELVVGKQFVSEIKETKYDAEDFEAMGNGFKLSLSLYDTTDPEKDILIEQHLVDIGRARRVNSYE